MQKKTFMQSGHWPTLLAAFFYFDISFMVWILLGPLAPFISEQLRLNAAEKGLLIAIPLLGGSLFRPLLGWLADRIGGRNAGLTGLVLTLAPLILGWKFATTVWDMYAIGFLLGIAGASFAVALPLAGRWYPPEYQGVVMGLAGAGNSGTLIATFFAPRVAQHYGWHAAFGLAALPVLAVLLLFVLLAKDSPRKAAALKLKDYASLLREGDALRLCFLYSLTFGGFVGLTSFLTLFFHDQYHVTKIRAGDFTTLVVVAGSFLRPVGGWLSDRFGGYRILLALLSGVAVCMGAISTLPPLTVVLVVLFAAMAMLGMGNGAVFQLAPLRYSDQIGIMTGIIGAAGGFGGFLLPSVLGIIKEHTGRYSTGIVFLSAIFFVGVFGLLEFGVRWRSTWTESAIKLSGIFGYRGNALVEEEKAA